VVKTNDDLTNLPQSTEVRATMLKAIIDNLDALAKNPDIPSKLLMEISGAYVQAGTVQGSRTGVANVGHEEEALRSMEKAVQVAEQAAAKGSSDPDLPHVRLTAHFDLAQIQLLHGDLAKAQVNYTAALNLAKAWEAAKPTDPRRRQDLASVFSGMADLNIRQGQVHESVANYRAALGVLEPIDAGSPERIRETAGVCYRNLGVALTDMGPLADALDAYRSAAKIREGLVEQYPSNVRYQRRLEVTYVDIGLVLGSEGGLGDPATAAVYMTKAREIAERLAKLDSSNNQAKEDLAGVYQNIGQVQSGLNPAAAVDWFLRSVAITRELLRISPVSVDYRVSLGIQEREVAEALGRTNRIPGALSHALASRDDLINLIRSQPPRKNFSRDLMRSYCVLADLQHQARDDAGASLSQQAAMHLFNVVAAGEENLDSDYSFAKCYEVFSRTDAAHSAEWLQKSGARWQTLTAAGVHR
jgi:tetratricopeptide (TPR) repeat protein